MVQHGETEFTLDTAAELAEAEPGAIRGRSPWYLAWRRLRRNYFAFAPLALFILIVAVCAAAPLYASHVAHTGPNDEHVLGTVKVNGVPTNIVSAGGIIKGKLVASIPIGPTWFNAGGKYVLGADTPAGARVAESARFFEFVSSELPLVIARWQESRGALDGRAGQGRGRGAATSAYGWCRCGSRSVSTSDIGPVSPLHPLRITTRDQPVSERLTGDQRPRY